MNAYELFETAPLGSLVRFCDGTPEPPARFCRKHAAWSSANASGRLVAIFPRRLMGKSWLAAGFVLQLGQYGADGVIFLTVSRHFELGCPHAFEIVECPRVGAVRVMSEWNGKLELHHLARDRTAAREWLAGHRLASPILAEVTEGEPGGLAQLRDAA